MHPAFSVIFLTTLIGVGQGLFLALYTGQLYSVIKVLGNIRNGRTGKHERVIIHAIKKIVNMDF